MTQDETESSRTDDELPEDRPLPGDGTYPAVAARPADQSPPEDRPVPGDGTPETDGSGDGQHDDGQHDDGQHDDGQHDDGQHDNGGEAGDGPPPGPDAEPVYNDRDKLDFDPDEGFYTGTAVTGDTAIPGEHERVDDVPIEEDGADATSSEDDAKGSDDS